MRAWQPLLMLAAAFGGCGQSCSCSCDGEAASTASVAAPATASARGTDGTPSPSATATHAPTPADGVAGQGGNVRASGSALKRWLDAAKADKNELIDAKTRLDAAKPGAAAATPAKLRAVFPASLAGFTARAPADEGTVKVGTAALPVASRSYQAPKSAGEAGDIYVKLTDVSAAPQLRAPVVAALTETSAVGGYYTRGGFVRGYPAVLTYAEAHRAGKAAVLLGDHYLLEARISPVASADDIASILGQLDWSRLVARDAD